MELKKNVVNINVQQRQSDQHFAVAMYVCSCINAISIYTFRYEYR